VNAGSLSQLYDDLLDVMTAYDEAAGWNALDGFKADVADLGDLLGLDIEKDVLPVFGGEVVVASSVPATLAIPPAVAMVEIKDKAAAAKLVAKALGMIDELAEEEIKLTETTFEGVKITTIAVDPMVTPSVAIVGDFLVVGTHPNAIKKLITTKAGGGKTLADDADFKKYVGGLPGNAPITLYVSVKRIFESGYPIVAGLAPHDPDFDSYMSILIDALGMLGDSFSGFGMTIAGDKEGVVVRNLAPNGGIIPGTVAGGASVALIAYYTFTVGWEDGGWDEEDWDDDAE
jgi:hypothetical protein